MDINRMFLPMTYSAGISQPTMMGDIPQNVIRNDVASRFSNENVCRVQNPQCSTIILPPSGPSPLPTPPLTLPTPTPTLPQPPPPPPLPPPPPPPISPLAHQEPSSEAGSSQIYERLQITKDLLKTVTLQPSFGSPKKIKKPIGMCTTNTSTQSRKTA